MAHNTDISKMSPGLHPTQYWHTIESGDIQCDLCPRHCKLKEGQRGLCFVRQRLNDTIVLTTYGRSSGYCIDPVEKKPLHHFLPGTPVLSFGTAGCNLACKFCQNWDISKSREMDTLMEYAMPENIALVSKKINVSSIAFTYNDPIIFLEYAIDCAKECKKLDIKTIAVTAGYINPEPRREFFQYMDAANVDLKAFTERFYKKITGSSLSTVLDTLLYIHYETECWFEITTLLIPGENDSDKEIEKECQWIIDNLGADIPIHFSAFRPDWKMIDKPATPPKTLLRAREIALKNGLHYVYTGNIHNIESDTTYCDNCQSPIIVRDWYNILKYELDDKGCCKVCTHKVPGIFDGPHGDWGARRRRIRIKIE